MAPSLPVSSVSHDPKLKLKWQMAELKKQHKAMCQECEAREEEERCKVAKLEAKGQARVAAEKEEAEQKWVMAEEAAHQAAEAEKMHLMAMSPTTVENCQLMQM